MLLLLGRLLQCRFYNTHQGNHVSGVLILHLLLKGDKVGLLLIPFCLLLSEKVHQPCRRLLLASSGAVLVIVVVHSSCLLVGVLLETYPESLVSCRGELPWGAQVSRSGG